MSSCSERPAARSSHSDISDEPRYAVSPRLISRRVADGVLVRRWDRDTELVLLNESAWLVVATIAEEPQPVVKSVLGALVALRADVSVEVIGDLRPTLDALVDGGLVEQM